MPDEREPPAPKEISEPDGKPAASPAVSPGELARRQELDVRFEEIYKKRYNSVVVFFVRMRFTRDKARDLAQETLQRVYEHLEGFRGTTEAVEVAFILETARNVAWNEIRKRHTRKRDGTEVPVSVELENVTYEKRPSAEEKLAEQEETIRRRKRLRAAIESLSVTDRICILAYIEGKSNEEIHVIMNVSVSAVKSRLRDIRARLRKILGEEPKGIDRTRKPPEGNRDRKG